MVDDLFDVADGRTLEQTTDAAARCSVAWLQAESHGAPQLKEKRLPSTFAFILHADIAGSTLLVQQDEELAHRRIQDTFRRFSATIRKYHGNVRELRGDALLAEFVRASDAVNAAVVFQQEQSEFLAHLEDAIRPRVRVGIAMGEVISADETLTGAGVVMAQRVEQLSEAGGVCMTGAIREALPQRLPFHHVDLGEQRVKGFDDSVRVYAVQVREGVALPEPGMSPVRQASPFSRRTVLAAIAVVVGAAMLTVWLAPWKVTFESVSVGHMQYPLPEKPSIAVLPFNNVGGRSGHDHFSDGLTDNIITTLSQLQELFVIARNSSFDYKGRVVKARQVAEEMGVRYVLEGSFQRVDDSIRIHAQLIDALNGRLVWAEGFDRTWTDVFALQDDIAQKITSALSIKLSEKEEAQLTKRFTTSIEAYDLYLRGMTARFKYSKAENARAQELFERAIELDPRFAAAYAALSLNHTRSWGLRWTDNPDVLDQALSLARKAIDLDESLPVAHVGLGWALLWKGQHAGAIAAQRRAIALDPGYADAYNRLAATLAFAGEGDEGIAMAKKAMRLNPNGRAGYPFNLGLNYFITGRYEEAISALQRSVTRSPEFAPAYLYLAATYRQLGKTEDASRAARRLRELTPDSSVHYWRSRLPFRDGSVVDDLFSSVVELL